MFDPDTAPGGGSYFFGPFETAARSLAVEPITAPVRSDADDDEAAARVAPKVRYDLFNFTPDRRNSGVEPGRTLGDDWRGQDTELPGETHLGGSLHMTAIRRRQ